jgi:hypothetical protein
MVPFIGRQVHFPFSILDLIFVIAGGDPDSMLDEHWAISRQWQMTDVIWKMLVLLDFAVH